MKKFIKLIISLCLISAIGIVGFMFIQNKIIPSINGGSSNNGGNNNGNSSQDEVQLNGNTGNSNFKSSNLGIDVKELTKEEKAKSLEDAKSNIAKEDIKNTYTTLFDNKTYTNSNYKYELNENTVSISNWFKFQNDFDTELEKAIARKENFLMYSTHGAYSTAHSNVKYDRPLIYGYIEGLGYIIGINNAGTLELTVENKYYSKINLYNYYKSYDDYINGTVTKSNDYNYDTLTLKSNNDTVKVTAGVIDEYNIGEYNIEYAEYVPNMVKTTIAGFTKDNRKYDYSNLASGTDISNSYGNGYNFYEGNFMNIIGENKAYHLYGVGYYESRTRNSSEFDSDDNYTYHAEKDNEFFWYGDPISLTNNTNTKYLTDFNNFFMSCGDNAYSRDISYAMFGEVADVYLKKIVNVMFSGDIKECNDFSNDSILEKKEDYSDETSDSISCTYESMRRQNAFDYIFWTIDDEGSGSKTTNYIYPITKKEADAYANEKKYVSTDASGNKHYYTCDASWYESLAEEDKPYIVSYVVVNDKLTVRRWQREWYYPIETTLDDNTLVFEKDVESFLDYAKKVIIESNTSATFNHSNNCWMVYTNENPDGLELISALLEYCSVERDVTTVTDETNVFNSRFN